MKEPGQLAYETWWGSIGVVWNETTPQQKTDWARVEAAVRADERAKALEEAADFLCKHAIKMQSGYSKIYAAADMIRALIEKPAAPYEGEK